MSYIKFILRSLFVHAYSGIFWIRRERRKRDVAEFAVTCLLFLILILPGLAIHGSLSGSRVPNTPAWYLIYVIVCLIMALALTFFALEDSTSVDRPIPRGSRLIGWGIFIGDLTLPFVIAFILSLLFPRG